VHTSPGILHAVPSFGTISGQPIVIGGPAHVHFGGGAMHGPPLHEVQRQIVDAPMTQTSPSVEHTCPLGGIANMQLAGGGSMQADFVVVHTPFKQVQSCRQSGRTESP